MNLKKIEKKNLIAAPPKKTKQDAVHGVKSTKKIGKFQNDDKFNI